MHRLPKVLVTGAGGQLGQCLSEAAERHPDINFLFESQSVLDITQKTQVLNYFDRHRPDFCINTAAYTAVDKAETEPEKAKEINVEGVKNLVAACQTYAVTLVQISTDFVFDGQKKTPYTENDTPHPINVYGQTKWEAEQWIRQHLQSHYIVRTSWLYSAYGHNFVKTMLRLAAQKKDIHVVNDQTGSPTSGHFLAEIILKIIKSKLAYGTYHCANTGATTWWQLAQKIVEYAQDKVPVRPVTSEAYPTLAKRPVYSALDASLLEKNLPFKNTPWQDALNKLAIFNNF